MVSKRRTSLISNEYQNCIDDLRETLFRIDSGELTNDEIKEIVSSNFSSYTNEDDSYQLVLLDQTIDFIHCCQKASQYATRLYTQNQQESNNVFHNLKDSKSESDRVIRFDALQAIIYIACERGLQQLKMAQAFAAIQLYFALLALKGCKQYKFFESELFAKCLDTMSSVVRSLKKTEPKSKKKTKKNNIAELDAIEIETDTPSPDELQNLLKATLHQLYHLLAIDASQIRNSENIPKLLCHTIQYLMQIDLNVNDEFATMEGEPIQSSTIGGLLWACTRCMLSDNVLCRPALIAICFPRLILQPPNNERMDRVPEFLRRARDGLIQLLLSVSVQNFDSEPESFLMMTFETCLSALMNTIEKQDFRRNTLAPVVELIVKLPFRRLFFRWLIHLAETTKTSNRVIAAEVIVIVLKKNDLFDDDNLHMLVRALIRCMGDKSVAVRQRAMTAFVDLCSSEQAADWIELFEINEWHQLPDSLPNLLDEDKNEGKTSNKQNEQTTSEQFEDGNDKHLNLASPNNGTNTIKVRKMKEKKAIEPAQGSFRYCILYACADDKIVVRKAALQALEAILTRRLEYVPKPNQSPAEQKLRELIEYDWWEIGVKLLKRACMDQALSVRKQACETVTQLTLIMPVDESKKSKVFQTMWLTHVMSLTTDRETTLSDMSSRMALEMLFYPLSKFELDEPPTKRAWLILKNIETNAQHRRYFSRHLIELKRQDKLPHHFLNAVFKIAMLEDSPFKKPAWMCLCEGSRHIDIDVNQVLLSWDAVHASGNYSDEIIAYQAGTMGNCAKRMPSLRRKQLESEILSLIESIEISYTNVPPLLYCLYQLMMVEIQGENKEVQMQEQLAPWATKVVEQCEKQLADVAFPPEYSMSQQHTKHNLLSRRPTGITPLPEENEKCSTSSQPPVISQDGATTSSQQSSQPNVVLDSDGFKRPISTISKMSQPMARTQKLSDDNIIARLCILAELCQYLPRLIHDRLFTLCEAYMCASFVNRQASMVSMRRPNSAFPSRQSCYTRPGTACEEYSPVVRAMAAVALGKLCLQREEFAKQCVQLLVRELTASVDAAIRNNCVLVLSDMCIRYTSVVDTYMPTILCSLKDPSRLVRRQTLTMLTTLLKEDFVRWKGMLLYRFLAAILDNDQEIREYTEFCLLNVLKMRHKNLFVDSFLECVFRFNEVDHPAFPSTALLLTVPTSSQPSSQASSNPENRPYSPASRTAIDDHASALFSLKGSAHASSRQHLYKFMADNMDDVERFRIMRQIATKGLNCFTDDSLPLTGDYCNVIEDILMILITDTLEIQVTKSNNEDEADLFDEGGAAAVFEANAMKKFFSNAEIKITMEEILPTILALKHIMQLMRHRLLPLIYLYIRKLMERFPEPMNEVLEGDQRTKAEVMYDMRVQREHERRVEEAQEKLRQLRLKRLKEINQLRMGCHQENNEANNANETRNNSTPLRKKTPPAIVRSISIAQARQCALRETSRRSLPPESKMASMNAPSKKQIQNWQKKVKNRQLATIEKNQPTHSIKHKRAVDITNIKQENVDENTQMTSNSNMSPNRTQAPASFADQSKIIPPMTPNRIGNTPKRRPPIRTSEYIRRGISIFENDDADMTNLPVRMTSTPDKNHTTANANLTFNLDITGMPAMNRPSRRHLKSTLQEINSETEKRRRQVSRKPSLTSMQEIEDDDSVVADHRLSSSKKKTKAPKRKFAPR